jgi:hypothetical protein
LPHHQAALRANPRNLSYRKFYSDSLLMLAKNHLDLGDPEKAVAALEELASAAAGLPDDSEYAYKSASHLARCAVLAGRDNRLTEEDRKHRANDSARRAVERLRAAVRSGFQDREKIQSDHDLDVLRTREDFQKFLAEVAAKRKD